MILDIYKQARPEEVRAGMRWYDEAHAWAAGVASAHGVPLEPVVAVTAALSPANKWERNKVDTEAMISAYANGEDMSAVKVCTYNRNKDLAIKAARRGIEVLSGPKTNAFAINILHPENEDVVTIDRHGYNIHIGERMIVSQRGLKVTPKRYRETASAYISRAGEIGIRPNQLQAITWLTWRRMLVESGERV